MADMAITVFTIGSTVKCISTIGPGEGRIGEVKCYEDGRKEYRLNDWIGVDFPGWSGGHTLDGSSSSPSSGYYILPSMIELVSPVAPSVTVIVIEREGTGPVYYDALRALALDTAAAYSSLVHTVAFAFFLAIAVCFLIIAKAVGL